MSADEEGASPARRLPGRRWPCVYASVASRQSSLSARPGCAFGAPMLGLADSGLVTHLGHIHHASTGRSRYLAAEHIACVRWPVT